jgi:multimeric flavodoxin WrbA
MRIVSINGSPNGMRGITGLVLGRILEQARHAGAETQNYTLNDYTVRTCRGCFSCSKTGTCPITDDYARLKEAVIHADGIIFASPNYMYHISSQMKVFIDRSFSFLYHLRKLVGKHAVAVGASGGPFADIVESYLLDILGKMGCWNVGSIGVSHYQLEDAAEKEKALQEAGELGERLVAAIRTQQTYRDQESIQADNHEVMRALMILRKDAWPFEYNYWKKHWALEEE